MGLLGVASVLFGGLKSLADGIGLIRGAVQLPETQRQLAGTRLHGAIDEIAKSFEVIEAQLVCLLGADLRSPAGRSALVELEGGSALVKLATMRGHCGVIHKIWEEDLSGVFQKITPNDFAAIEEAFRSLDNLDGVMLKASQVLADGLASEAEAILDLVDNGQIATAQHRLLQVRAEVRDLRRFVNHSLAEMVELRFVLRARA